MSVLIKGMEMPPSCRYCEFRHLSLTQNAFCTAAQKTIDYMDERTKRLDNCPLIELPPHGRLVDADALEQDAQKRLLMCNKNNNQFQKPYEVMRAIVLAPTIIEAEGSETDEDQT